MLQAFGTFRQSVEQFLRLGEVGDRFRVRRAAHRLFGRGPQIRDCGLSEIGAGVVVSEELGLGLHHVRKSLLQRLRDLAVVMMPPVAHQRLVRRFLNQRVLESVASRGRIPLLEQELRVSKLLQLRIEPLLRDLCDIAEQPRGKFVADD